MALIKDERESLRIEEAFSVKHEETEEQTDLKMLKEERGDTEENEFRPGENTLGRVQTDGAFSLKSGAKGKFTCQQCGKGFIRKGNLNVHMRVHSGETPHSAPGGEGLEAHRSARSGETPHSAPGGEGLEAHRSARSGETPHSAPGGEGLEAHRSARSGEKPFECAQCGKRFPHKASFRNHKQIHSERVYTCKLCGKNLKTKKNLKVHMITHTGERPFRCDQCGKVFAHKSSLKKHLKIHLREASLTCLQCGTAFTDRSHLKRHIRTHIRKESVMCRDCGKSFSTKMSLKNHLRVHTKENLFPCQQCGKRFRHKQTLNVHMRDHHARDEACPSPVSSRPPAEEPSPGAPPRPDDDLTEDTGHDRQEICKKHDQLLKKQLKETQIQIQQRQREVERLREAVESHRRSAQTAVEDIERIFSELMRSIKRSGSEFTQLIRDQEETAVSGAEGRLELLKQEISELRRRNTELERRSHTHHQSSPSPSAPPESTDVNDSPFCPLVSFDDVTESVRQLRLRLTAELKLISDRVALTNVTPWTRKHFLQYFHELSLDLNTLNRKLSLSERKSVITSTDSVQPYGEHPERFHGSVLQVLCRESVCGRCYWEAEWSGDDGVFISVSYKSIRRKGALDCLFGYNDRSWSLICSPDSYSFKHNNVESDLPVCPTSRRVGVYVDQPAGTLSFYSVSDRMSLIHSVHTSFTEPLYPGFYLHYGSSVKLCTVRD